MSHKNTQTLHSMTMQNDGHPNHGSNLRHNENEYAENLSPHFIFNIDSE